MKAKAGADLRKPNPAGERTAPRLQNRESFEPVAATKTRQSRSPTDRGKGNPTSNVVRADYRAVRAAREGKKYINILINEELQLEVRARMMLRKLTWESLIESLLQKWLDENPTFVRANKLCFQVCSVDLLQYGSCCGELVSRLKP